MEKTLVETVSQHHMIKRGDKVLVGISGGPDSVALAHWLYTHREPYGIKVILAHYHHGLRGEEADEDERFVRLLAEKWQVEYFMEKVPLKEILAQEHGNLQALAREYRYRFFREVGERIGATKVAIAHHRDDQAETLLMRFLRGTGVGGLAGIPYTRPLTEKIIVIRPLLDITRDEIEAYLKRNHLTYRIDSSNRKTDYMRNRLRIELIPELLKVNANLTVSLNQLAQMVREDEEYLSRKAEEALHGLISERSDKQISISLKGWSKIPLSLQRRGIKLICNYLVQMEEEVPYHHIEAVRKLFAEDRPRQWNLPWGIEVLARYGEGIFRLKTEERRRGFYYPFHVPGSLWIREIERRFSSSILHQLIPVEGEEHAFFDYEKVAQLGPFVLRSRKEGDQIYVKGLGGHKKVKDIFIDAKVPKEDRDLIPIFAAGNEILWIPGFRKADVGEVDEKTQRILLCKMADVEG